MSMSQVHRSNSLGEDLCVK